MIPYTNRELSWLEFNQRVLEESKRPDLPLLERVKFLAISGSNLDEFFQVRIGGLSQQQQNGEVITDPSGMSINRQLHETRARAKSMMLDQYQHWNENLSPALAEHGIHIVSIADLSTDARQKATDQANRDILPVLTPIALQYEASNLSIPALQICIVCQLESENEEPRHAIVPIPSNLPRFIQILDSPDEVQFLLLEDLIASQLSEIFPHERVSEYTFFRITKNSDIVLEDEEARDLANEMQQVLMQRQFGDAVRVELASSTSDELIEVISQHTGANENHFITLDGPLGISEFFPLSQILGFEDLKFQPWHSHSSTSFDQEESIFDTLDDSSITLFHPYESFDPVIRMIEEASEDPQTLAIKQVLYRTASKSRIIAALIKAALNGKQVTVLIELKARFDEARNLLRAEELRRAGVQVIYGVKGYKTHAKATLIVRKTPLGIKRYVHLGTGNYNETTANLYTDVSYLSSNPELGSDASLFFNMLTGHSKMTRFQKLKPAPTHMKQHIIELIQREADLASQGQPARILGKMNSLQDPEVITALYQASQAGVQIQLNVRGICCLQPGIQGQSENIRVVSIIDRYLEHTRAFYFEQAGAQKTFISSADWMVRNLDKRLELMIPIEDEKNKKRLISYLEACFRDNTNAYRILEDGRSARVPANPEAPFRFQEHLYNQAVRKSQAAQEGNAMSFEPHIGINL